MIDILYKISVGVLAALLAVMIVLIAVIGCEEMTLTVLGWITAFFILSTCILYFLKRRDGR